MRSEETLETMEDSRRPDDTAGQGGPCPGLVPAAPGHLGAPYSEAWGYFHLAPARPGHSAGTWATCRLCGEQPSSAAAAEGDWARLLEQMRELAMRGSRREQELDRREAALQQAERALERRRRALRQEERALEQARRQLQTEREGLSAWLREQSPASAVSASPSPRPLFLKEDPDGDDHGNMITKVLL